METKMTNQPNVFTTSIRSISFFKKMVTTTEIEVIKVGRKNVEKPVEKTVEVKDKDRVVVEFANRFQAYRNLDDGRALVDVRTQIFNHSVFLAKIFELENSGMLAKRYRKFKMEEKLYLEELAKYDAAVAAGNADAQKPEEPKSFMEILDLFFRGGEIVVTMVHHSAQDEYVDSATGAIGKYTKDGIDMEIQSIQPGVLGQRMLDIEREREEKRLLKLMFGEM